MVGLRSSCKRASGCTEASTRGWQGGGGVVHNLSLGAAGVRGLPSLVFCLSSRPAGPWTLHRRQLLLEDPCLQLTPPHITPNPASPSPGCLDSCPARPLAAWFTRLKYPSRVCFLTLTLTQGPGLSRGQQGPMSLGHHLLPSRVYTGRMLGPRTDIQHLGIRQPTLLSHHCHQGALVARDKQGRRLGEDSGLFPMLIRVARPPGEVIDAVGV